MSSLSLFFGSMHDRADCQSGVSKSYSQLLCEGLHKIFANAPQVFRKGSRSAGKRKSLRSVFPPVPSATADFRANHYAMIYANTH
jgi:hypothetical protein